RYTRDISRRTSVRVARSTARRRLVRSETRLVAGVGTATSLRSVSNSASCGSGEFTRLSSAQPDRSWLNVADFYFSEGKRCIRLSPQCPRVAVLLGGQFGQQPLARINPQAGTSNVIEVCDGD